jgi:hypothetical protein
MDYAIRAGSTTGKSQPLLDADEAQPLGSAWPLLVKDTAGIAKRFLPVIKPYDLAITAST